MHETDNPGLRPRPRKIEIQVAFEYTTLKEIVAYAQIHSISRTEAVRQLVKKGLEHA